MSVQGDNKTKVVLNWSSGKDAALAYHILLQSGLYNLTHLLTTINDESDRIVMHGIREELLDAQADRIGIPLLKLKLPAMPTDEAYKSAMESALLRLKGQDISTAAFGDIFLEDLRGYREQQLAKVGFEAVFPLWKRDTRDLVHLVEATDIEAIIVCVNEKFLGREFLGRKIDAQLLNDLPGNVDPCGENGEFHTFVYNAPFFSAPIQVQHRELIYKAYTPSVNETVQWNTGFYFMDVVPVF